MHSESSGSEDTDQALAGVDLDAQAVVFKEASEEGTPLCDT